MKSINTRTRLVGVMSAIAMAATGGVVSASAPPADDMAGSEPGSDFVGTCETALDEDDSVDSLSELDFSGLELTVGSKDFAEQFVLGALAVVALEAGGATVTDSTNLGGTVVNREAMLAGEIDMYFDYNGTGWTEFLGQEDPSDDPDQLTDDVCNLDLEENNVRWLGRSPFNNTYCFATGPDLLNEDGEPFTMQQMADYIAENSDATVCMEVEFPDRSDGLVLFEEATGVVIPQEQIEILETGVIYNETAQGNCDFGEVFTTDGRIAALDLNLVQDPGIMIIYNASLTMLDETFQQAPEDFEALADTLLNPLTAEVVSELQRQVSIDQIDPIEVATNFLTEQGLLEG